MTEDPTRRALGLGAVGTRALRGLLPVLVLVFLAGCGDSSSGGGCKVVTAPAPGKRTAPKPTAALAAGKQYDVVFDTSCGDFTVRLDQAQSPHAAASFVSLVQHGYFDRTIFHRIALGFVIQGGDPTATGRGGPGYTTVDTPPTGASYSHGTVAMAKTAAQPAGAAGSQFFVVTEDDAGLPPDYAVVGTVTAGLDVVDRIGALGDASEQPTEVVEIDKASVEVS